MSNECRVRGCRCPAYSYGGEGGGGTSTCAACEHQAIAHNRDYGYLRGEQDPEARREPTRRHDAEAELEDAVDRLNENIGRSFDPKFDRKRGDSDGRFSAIWGFIVGAAVAAVIGGLIGFEGGSGPMIATALVGGLIGAVTFNRP